MNFSRFFRLLKAHELRPTIKEPKDCLAAQHSCGWDVFLDNHKICSITLADEQPECPPYYLFTLDQKFADQATIRRVLKSAIRNPTPAIKYICRGDPEIFVTDDSFCGGIEGDTVNIREFR